MSMFFRSSRFGLLFAVFCFSPGYPVALSQQDAAPTVQTLLDVLEKGSVDEQLDAVNQLQSLGPYAHGAIDQLVKKMHTADPALRYECIAALGRIGPLAHKSSDSLTPFLKADSELFQSAALESLRRIGTSSPEAAAQVRKLCQSPDASIATSAIRCLVIIGGENDDLVQGSIPRLVNALGEERTAVRNEAAVTLAEIGPSVVPAVTKALTDSDYRVRMKACEILGQLESAAASAVPMILPLLKDDHDLVVRVAAKSLGNIHSEPQRVLPALNGLLQHASTPIRIVAVRAIAEFGPLATSSVPLILRLLSDESIVLRASAADALGKIGDGRAEVIDGLVRAISDADGSVTVKAANALSQIGAPAVPALIPKLSEPGYRMLVVEVLGEMREQAESAVPALVDLLSIDDKDLRRETYIALATIGPKANAAKPALMKILEDPTKGEARAGAAYVLAHMGEKKALPALRQIMETNQGEDVIRSVAWAIVTLEPENVKNVSLVMPHLIKATSSEIPLVRKEAMSAFRTLGPAAIDALPALLQHATSDPEAIVRAESLKGLAEIQAPATQTLPLAIASLEDPDMTVRNSARYLLGSLGEDAQGAAPMLRETLRRGDLLERIVSGWALVHVEPTAANIEAAIPSLLHGLQYPNSRVRKEVAITLGTTGTKSKDVLTDLGAARNDPDPEVKEAATKAFAQLTKTP